MGRAADNVGERVSLGGMLLFHSGILVRSIDLRMPFGDGINDPHEITAIDGDIFPITGCCVARKGVTLEAKRCIQPNA